MLENFLGGLAVVMQPLNLLLLTSAVFIGFIGGALPGISGVAINTVSSIVRQERAPSSHVATNVKVILAMTKPTMPINQV